MAHNVIMPKMGVTVTECILGAWYKQEGDTVQAGEPLFSYETDKTCADEMAPADGTILAVFCEEGDVAFIAYRIASRMDAINVITDDRRLLAGADGGAAFKVGLI